MIGGIPSPHASPATRAAGAPVAAEAPIKGAATAPVIAVPAKPASIGAFSKNFSVTKPAASLGDATSFQSS